MGNAEEALRCFGSGSNCAQSVLATYAEEFGRYVSIGLGQRGRINSIADSLWCRLWLLWGSRPRQWRVSPAPLLLLLPLDGTLDQSAQLIYRTVDSFAHGGRLVSDREGPVAFEVRFDHAADVVIAALLVTVLIAQMDLHLHDLIAESVQGALHDSTDLRGPRRLPFNVTVGVDLDLHGFLLLEL